MKQSPSNLKFKKFHRPASKFLKLQVNRFFMPLFGYWGLQSLSAGKLTFKHIEAARRSIRRTTKKAGKLWINLFTNASISKKSVGSRMGNGKGLHSYWVCPIRQGQILYELAGISRPKAYKALLNAGSKLPVKTRVVKLVY